MKQGEFSISESDAALNIQIKLRYSSPFLINSCLSFYEQLIVEFYIYINENQSDTRARPFPLSLHV